MNPSQSDANVTETAAPTKAVEQNGTKWNMGATPEPGSMPRQDASETASIDADIESLTERQRAVVACLMAGASLGEVGRKLGIGRTTLYRWRQEPIFARVLGRMSREAMETSAIRIRNLLLESTDLIASALRTTQGPHWALRLLNSRQVWARADKPLDLNFD